MSERTDMSSISFITDMQTHKTEMFLQIQSNLSERKDICKIRFTLDENQDVQFQYVKNSYVRASYWHKKEKTIHNMFYTDMKPTLVVPETPVVGLFSCFSSDQALTSVSDKQVQYREVAPPF